MKFRKNVSGGGGGSTNLTEKVQTGDYTFVLSDADDSTVVVLNSVNAHTFTIPPHSSVAWVIGSSIGLLSISTGILSIAASGGVTLQSPYNKVQVATRYARATLICRDIDVWSLEGNLA